MSLPRLDGERVVLRPMTPEDANATYLAWLHDEEITEFMEVRHSPPPDVAALRAFVAAQLSDPAIHFFAIDDQSTGRHVGNLKLGPIDTIHQRAEIGILLGDRSVWRKGLATEAIELVSAYAFETLGLHKLTAGMYAPNVGSLRAFERAGFRREALLRAHARLDQEWVDQISVGRLAGEARSS